LRAECPRGFRQQALDHMGLARDENREARRPGRREVDPRLHAQAAAFRCHAAQHGFAIEIGGGPRGLQRHAELAARDLLLQRLDVRAELEKQLSDSGDDAGLVPANEGDGGKFARHAGATLAETVIQDEFSRAGLTGAIAPPYCQRANPSYHAAMKLSLASILVLIAVPVLAQTPAAPADSAPPAQPGGATPPPGASAMGDKLTSTLTPEEKQQLLDDKTKVMAANPDLQSEQMDLMQQGMALQDGSATEEDKQALKEQFKTYVAKVRAAMIKLDPSIEPVLKKVEAQGAQIRMQHSADAPAPGPQ
jgi:hypothetical protein